MIRNTEIARVSGGASGHRACDTQRVSAGSAPILSTTILTRTSAKTYRRSSGSRPAALRSGIYPGESRGEIGQKDADPHFGSANLAPLPASAGAIPAIFEPTPVLEALGSHHSVRMDGRSASHRAMPVVGPPSALIPGDGNLSAKTVEMPKQNVRTGIFSPSEDRTEGAINPVRPSSRARPPSAKSPKGGDLDHSRRDALRRPVEIAFITPTAEGQIPVGLASACKSGATVVSQTPISTASLPTIRSSEGRAGSTKQLRQPRASMSIPQPFTAEAYPQPEVPTP